MERYRCDVYCEGCTGDERAHRKTHWGWAGSKIGARHFPQHRKEISGKGNLFAEQNSQDGSKHLLGPLWAFDWRR